MAFYFFVFKDDWACVFVHNLKFSQNFIFEVLCAVLDIELDTVGIATVGGHDLDGIELMIRLGSQLEVALSKLLGQLEVKYVVIKRQL